MYDFPQDPAKIRARIRRYERALLREQASYGFINDGGGKRYLLGPLYLLMGDTALIIPHWWISSKILTLPETADENAQ